MKVVSFTLRPLFSGGKKSLYPDGGWTPKPASTPCRKYIFLHGGKLIEHVLIQSDEGASGRKREYVIGKRLFKVCVSILSPCYVTE
jgi:hypothetical protein